MRLAAIACLAALCVGGCSEASSDGGEDTRPDRRDPAAAPSPPRARLEAAHCPAELTNCKTASGRIIYVERVDPDGDGDAHFVLTSREAITLPGLSVIDVKKELRPHPLPGPGDRISAAGPVYRGSYGQKQIEAIELHVARR